MPQKELFLEIQGRVIDHLGIAMYQNAVNAVAELIANAWDADAETVEITIPSTHDPENFEILIKDNGTGMTFDECQNYFLQVGRNRRIHLETDKSGNKKRPVLGRKGIGKFAGFGIATIIEIDTISAANGEHTIFKLDIDNLRTGDAGQFKKPVEVIKSDSPNTDRVARHGTTIRLQRIRRSRGIGPDNFAKKMSRRFLLSQIYDPNFTIAINGNKIPDCFAESFEYTFPSGYLSDEIPDGVTLDQGWGIENLAEGKTVRWRIGFFEKPITDEELRGISVFTKGKLSQKPFLFNLSGGISAQHGIEYMTGQVIADFVDEGETDLIATERQRLNWETDDGQLFQRWGQNKIKELTSIWKGNRAKKRQNQVEDKISGFKDRLDNLGKHERETVKKALMKLASIVTLTEEQLKELGNAILLSWEQGRLHDLIHDISNSENMDSSKLISILVESQILTSLSIAEAVTTKIAAINELKKLIDVGALENDLRDYIYKNPWIISPEWECFIKESSLVNVIKKAGANNFSDGIYNGRVDMVLCNGNQLIILEFMKPKLDIDRPHIHRFNDYIIEIESQLETLTGVTPEHNRYRVVAGYLIADNKKQTVENEKRIKEMEDKHRYALTWDMLLCRSLKQWQEFLEILKNRNPNDSRIKNLKLI